MNKTEVKVPKSLYERLIGNKDRYGLYRYLLLVYERHPKDFKISYEKMIQSLNQNHFNIDTTESDRLFALFKDNVISSHVLKFREAMNAIVDRALILEDEIYNVVYDRMDNDNIYFRVIEVE